MIEYNPNDFTLETYEDLLLIAKKKFKFVSYTEAQKSDHYVLWRHDIDYSVHRALNLAQIEKKHDVNQKGRMNQ